MEITILAIISAAAIYIVVRHMIRQFKEKKPCHDCDGCGSRCGRNKSHTNVK